MIPDSRSITRRQLEEARKEVECLKNAWERRGFASVDPAFLRERETAARKLAKEYKERTNELIGLERRETCLLTHIDNLERCLGQLSDRRVPIWACTVGTFLSVSLGI